MKKNSFLYDFIFEKLSNNNKFSFVEMDEMAKKELAEAYNQKQLRNLLYNLANKEVLKVDNERRYYRNNINHKSNVILEYLKEIESICKKTENKLKNPFDFYHGEELLEAEKLYTLNKQVFELIRNYEKEYSLNDKLC